MPNLSIGQIRHLLRCEAKISVFSFVSTKTAPARPCWSGRSFFVLFIVTSRTPSGSNPLLGTPFSSRYPVLIKGYRTKSPEIATVSGLLRQFFQLEIKGLADVRGRSEPQSRSPAAPFVGRINFDAFPCTQRS